MSKEQLIVFRADNSWFQINADPQELRYILLPNGDIVQHLFPTGGKGLFSVGILPLEVIGIYDTKNSEASLDLAGNEVKLDVADEISEPTFCLDPSFETDSKNERVIFEYEKQWYEVIEEEMGELRYIFLPDKKIVLHYGNHVGRYFLTIPAEAIGICLIEDLTTTNRSPESIARRYPRLKNAKKIPTPRR